MQALLLRTALSVLLIGPLALHAARADITTWRDSSGSIHMTNLPPPEGAKIVKVVPESPRNVVASIPPTAPADAIAAMEVRNLAERVRQLEYELDLARQAPPPTVAYAAIPAPPPVQYAAPPVQYAVPMQYAGPAVVAPDAYGCDPLRFGCGNWWWPAGYPASVVVVGTPAFRRHMPHRAHHDFGRLQGDRKPTWVPAGTKPPPAARTSHPHGMTR